jgi:hypothetical protein
MGGPHWLGSTGGVALAALVLLGVTSGSPVGHLQPLGAHRRPETSLPVETGFIPPKRFFDEYVVPRRPVVFRGAADSWPARYLWSDEYLRSKIGKKKVEV